MTTQFSSKQPAEAYAISFDFTLPLGTENIASASIVAIDQTTGLDVSTTILEVLNQTNTTKIVYGWVQNGTSGRDYLLTCTIIGDDTPASTYELDGILPVQEIPASVAASSGGTRCVTEPTLEPVTLAELKRALNIDSDTFDGNLTITQCLSYGSKGVSAGSAYTHIGTPVDVLGKQVEVLLHCGTNAATGTNDTKIQECDTLAGSYTDWATGAFTQVTTANDNADFKKVYTGSKKYIRTASKVLLAACEFGTSILTSAPMISDDDELNELIANGRLAVENDTSKKIMSQTWDYCPKSWPSGDRIKIPFGNLTSVTSVKWKDSDGTETTLVENTDYVVIQNGTQCGFIGLLYQGSWPSGTLYPHNPITIRFTCGWVTAAEVPSIFKQAVKKWCVNNYANKGDDVSGVYTVNYDKTYSRQINLCGRLNDMDFEL